MVVILSMGLGLFAPPLGVGYCAACAIGRVNPDEGIGPIVGYMAALPTWAYHGAAYGMGDFSNNAKWSEPKERQRERAAPRHDVAG